MRAQHPLCFCVSVLQMVSLLMIGIAAWGKWFGLVSSFQVVGGIIGVGVFLFFVALAGLIGAMKHHQVLLFFWQNIHSWKNIMTQLNKPSSYLLLSVITHSRSVCASRKVHGDKYGSPFSPVKDELLEVGWNNSQSTQRDVEKSLNCCGFKHFYTNVTCDAACFPNNSCSPCANKIQEHAGEVLHFVGGIGLFFSFTEHDGSLLESARASFSNTPTAFGSSMREEPVFILNSSSMW
ncbi:tetraspanin-13b isoform X2 [Sparus aurata]|uniref:tetraspanin-13b isoform X2 n=1 Tax=Sparus aurata TaxID=8175 RepID=UPI0011C0D2A1|nr:tetraspanin-13 isoform X2 [Sparus aurata]